MDQIIKSVRFQPSFLNLFLDAYKYDATPYNYIKFYLNLFVGKRLDFYDGRVYVNKNASFNSWIFDFNFKHFKFDFYKFLISIFQYKFLCEKDKSKKYDDEREILILLKKTSFYFPYDLAKYWENDYQKNENEKKYLPLFDSFFNIKKGTVKKSIGSNSNVKYPFWFEKKYYRKGKNKNEKRFQKLIGGLFLYDYIVIICNKNPEKNHEIEEFAVNLISSFSLGLQLRKNWKSLEDNTNYFNVLLTKNKNGILLKNHSGLILINSSKKYGGITGDVKRNLIEEIPKRVKRMDMHELFFFILYGAKSSYKIKSKSKKMKRGKEKGINEFGIFQKLIKNFEINKIKLKNILNLE